MSTAIASQEFCVLSESEELPMTMQVGMVGTDGLVLAGDTRQYVERSGRTWSSYNSSKIRLDATGRMAIACARNMEVSLRIAEKIFAELPVVNVEDRAVRIQNIGMGIAAGFDAECIVAFADPVPSLYAFLCDKIGNGRCDELDRILTGDAGNPACFWAERYYTRFLGVSQLTRLAAQIVVAAGTMNSGSIQGLEVVTLEAAGFRRWSKEENYALEFAADGLGKQIGELVLGRPAL